MKKKNWIETLSVFAISIVLAFFVGCNKEKKEPPQAPTGLRVDASDGYVTWTWNPVEDADFYHVEYNRFSGPVYGTSYTDGRFIGEVDLDFAVAAVNEYGKSAYSSIFYHYSPNNGGGGNGGGSGSAPSAPTNVYAEVSGTQIKVTWNGVSDASSYTVYWSSTGNNYSTHIGTTSNTYIYDNEPYEDNYYKVMASNAYGDSELSASAYCHYTSGGGGGGGGGSAPSAPTGVSAEVSGSQIKVSWNSVSTATQYTVYRSTSASGSYTSIGTTSSTYYYDGNPSTYNYYKVKAKNSNGESSYSSYAYCYYSSGGGGGGGGSTNYAPCPPSVSASGTASSITVSWTKATGTGCGNPTSYKVYKRNPFTSSYELKTTTSSTSYRDTDVHPGINRYAVEAINNYGSDEGYGYSSSITLPKPSSFTAQKSGSEYVKFTWSKVSQATGYQIFISTSASGNYTILDQIDDVNTTTHTRYYPGESGRTYYFKMRAVWIVSGTYKYSDLTTYKSVTF